MLNHVHVRDFAIVDELELEFGAGMTVLTGETGAGKSILVDALGLALGDRASADTVRPGAERTEISATFDVSALEACQEWLRDNELDDDTECLVRRTVQAGGRSRAFINGRAVPLSQVRTLGEFLLDIHGQHEHQSLMRRDVQRTMVDRFADNDALLRDVAALHRDLESTRKAMDELRGGFADQQARRDLLAYQTQELQALDLSPEGLEALETEHRRLANADSLAEGSQRLLTLLYEDEQAAQSLLGQGLRELDDLVAKDPELAPARDALGGAQAQLEDAVATLRQRLDSLEIDPQRLQALEDQIATLSDLARKHQVREDELGSVRDRLQAELEALDNSGERLAELETRYKQLEDAYTDKAHALRERRQTAAEELARRVTEQLGELSMADAAFHVAVAPLAQESPTPHGLDEITFQVRTNAGQPFGPLNRIASGGELSRLSLAIQVAAAGTAAIPTLIFDEADAGIGGGVAEVVGRQLRSLGAHHQVLCVTHLPQVASQAHHHLQVAKYTRDETTATTVQPLAREERVEELARMLGGIDRTQTTMEHAAEMLDRGASA